MKTDTVRDVGRPKKDEPTAQLRLPLSVIRRLRRLASHADEDASDYTAELLGPVIDRAEAKMLTDIAKERKGDGE